MVSDSYLFLPFSPKTVTLKLDSNPGLVHQRDPPSSRFPWTLQPKRRRLRNIFPITIDTIKFFLPSSKSICSSFTFMFDEQTQVAIRPASRCFNDGHLDFCLGCIWHRVKSSDCLFRWSLARLRNEWTDGLSSSVSHLQRFKRRWHMERVVEMAFSKRWITQSGPPYKTGFELVREWSICWFSGHKIRASLEAVE